MTPTAYIVTPIDQKPEKAKWYDMAFDDGSIPNCPTYFDGQEFKGRNPDHTHWLRPVDLSRMLEEAWEAAEKRRKFYEKRVMGLVTVINSPNEPPDKVTYINSVLNPPK